MKNVEKVQVVRRTLRLPATLDQELERMAALAYGGNVSALAREVFEGALQDSLKRETHVNRTLEEGIRNAQAYMKAKEVSIQFETDVDALLEESGLKKSKISIEKGVRFSRGEAFFFADFVLTNKDTGEKIVINCKSGSRKERLQLALGESILGKIATGYKVVMVLPYFTPDATEMKDVFTKADVVLTDIGALRGVIKVLLGSDKK